MKNKKRDKIISSTIKLFHEQGIKKTTMDEIAKSANVSKVTIYKYFGDKESFYAKISNYIFIHYFNALDRINNSKDELHEKLNTFMNVITDFSKSGKLSICNELSKYNDNILAQQKLYQSIYKKTLFSLINQGKNDNVIRNDVDTEKIYFYIDMGISYFQNNLEYRDKILSNSDFQNNFMEFFINNIFVNRKIG